jgi:MoxR-like ATPase
VERVIKGKSDVVELAVVTLLARGHMLVEDVPGVGKTTLAHALARSVDCRFQRIQFTSDLLPSDLTGISVFNQVHRDFEFRPGPLFANVVLADEVNRTTPRTQSALLEAMSEAKITVDNHTHLLPQPFMVIATQNPTEHHGTYPLPESQLDRFLMRISMGYPSESHEMEILRSQGQYETSDLDPVISTGDLLRGQEEVQEVRFEETLVEYLMTLVRVTRECELLALGVSTRGAMFLYRAAQALAYFRGRSYCIPDDVKRLVVPVFSHRVLVSPRHASPLEKTQEAESIIADLVDQVEVPV